MKQEIKAGDKAGFEAEDSEVKSRESLVNQGIQGLMTGSNWEMKRKRAERKSGQMPEDRSAQWQTL